VNGFTVLLGIEWTK